MTPVLPHCMTLGRFFCHTLAFSLPSGKAGLHSLFPCLECPPPGSLTIQFLLYYGSSHMWLRRWLSPAQLLPFTPHCFSHDIHTFIAGWQFLIYLLYFYFYFFSINLLSRLKSHESGGNSYLVSHSSLTLNTASGKDWTFNEYALNNWNK
jgi:hypothetical protein